MTQFRAFRLHTLFRIPILALILMGLSGCSTTSPKQGATFGTEPDSAASQGAATPATRLVLPGLIEADEAYQELIQLPRNVSATQRDELFAKYGEGVEAAGRRLMRKLEMSELTDPLYVRAAEDKSKIYKLNFDSQGRGDPYWEAAYFTGVEFAEDVKQPRGEAPQTNPGLGVPVILLRDYDEEFGKENPTLPLNGIHQPATVILEFSGSTDQHGIEEIDVRLYDSRGIDTVKVGDRNYPPAEDLSAAIALSMRKGYWLKFAWLGFFNPRDQLAGEGLYAIQRYDPNRIPVVFVHGLRSDPHIWQNAMNAILADRELAKRYQLWYYLYPTGLPIPSAGSAFRKSLYATQRHFDPEGDDPGLNQTILIGHSMGGILSRMQATDSGMDFWNAHFKTPPGTLRLWRTDRKALQDSLIFEPVPFIDRNVYIATPHRGSKMANWGPIEWLMNFVRRPPNLVNLALDLTTLNTDKLQPELTRYRQLGTTGVDTLSPEHPFFAALEEKPILVPYHSIIGNWLDRPLLESTDGVVPYVSSHLEGAESELVIPAGHGCVERPETTAEIIRILRLHADMPPPPRPKAKPKKKVESVKPVTPESRLMTVTVAEPTDAKPKAPKRQARPAGVYKR